jgi:hypothetical protein
MFFIGNQLQRVNTEFGELSGLSDGKRLVVLSGTAEFNQSVGSIDAIRPDVEQALKLQGFDVAAVRITKSGLTRFSTLNIQLELNVYNNYTAEEVRQSAINTLANAKRRWFGDFNYLTNVTMKVVNNYQTTTKDNGADQSTLEKQVKDLANALDPTKLLSGAGTTSWILVVVLVGIIIMKR